MFHKEIRNDLLNRKKIKKHEIKQITKLHLRLLSNSSHVCYHDLSKKNYCLLTARGRGVWARYKISRIVLRNSFSSGLFANIFKKK